ncbi:cell division protein ZapD [Granulosicoccaceae sp. 1_MG-2023]|nr:cell division protein ZapD [Granulosicoccaceae sp. 1_MG-2023]
MTVFEHPLNERIRSFMRLQQLFERLDHHLNGLSRIDLHASIGVLLEAYELTSRNNLKTEAIKELERQKQAFQPPLSAQSSTDEAHDEEAADDGDKPAADKDEDEDEDAAADAEEAALQARLTLENITALRNALHAQPPRSSHHLQNNDFLNSVRQRCGINGSGSTYDLPLYHFWLDRDVIDCRNTIIEWMEPYKQLREAINLILDNIRHQARFETIVAERGFYQNSLKSDRTPQLVRVHIPEKADIYPEISAGIHRITIRFMQYNSANEKPVQNLDDITFEIATCAI